MTSPSSLSDDSFEALDSEVIFPWTFQIYNFFFVFFSGTTSTYRWSQSIARRVRHTFPWNHGHCVAPWIRCRIGRYHFGRWSRLRKQRNYGKIASRMNFFFFFLTFSITLLKRRTQWHNILKVQFLSTKLDCEKHFQTFSENIDTKKFKFTV